MESPYRKYTLDNTDLIINYKWIYKNVTFFAAPSHLCGQVLDLYMENVCGMEIMRLQLS